MWFDHRHKCIAHADGVNCKWFYVSVTDINVGSSVLYDVSVPFVNSLSLEYMPSKVLTIQNLGENFNEIC